jgi:hypothetical protein
LRPYAELEVPRHGTIQLLFHSGAGLEFFILLCTCAFSRRSALVRDMVFAIAPPIEMRCVGK